MSLSYVRIVSLVAVVMVGLSTMAPAVLAATPSRPCTCTSSVGLNRPRLQFVNGTLTFFPEVNISLRSRAGSSNNEPWTATLNYDGSTAYSSSDVSVPSGVSFSGSQSVFHGTCGTNSHVSFNSLSLPPVTLSGLTREMVGHRQEVKGTLLMHAQLTGCGADEENRMFTFSLRELGRLFVGGWRSIR